MRLFLLLVLAFGSLMSKASAAEVLVTVRLSQADICFQGQCYPALLGPKTFPGRYDLSVLHVISPGYGGDVLMYDSTASEWYAIHRTYNYGNVNRHGLYSDTTPAQRFVTAGCVNVQPDVYDLLRACCSDAELEVID